jgi:tripartite-type tricarboxylate transporter receptor subunit TctC
MFNNNAKFIISIFIYIYLIYGSNYAISQNYPTRAIRIVTSDVGGSADIGARILAQGISSSLGKQVIIENKGSGVIPGETVSRALPDGYTLLFFGGTFWLQPQLRLNVSYDPILDFSPITLVFNSPSILVAHPTLPVNSVNDLISLAKSRPGQLNYGMGSSGSTNHLAAELFKNMANVNIIGIPYRGNGPAVNGLLSNQVQIMFATAMSVIPQIKSGRLKALAVASAKPTQLAPGLPTISDSGLPGYESISSVGFFAPAKTPLSVIKKLNYESVKFLNSSDGKEKYLQIGSETVGSTSEELSSIVKSEINRMSLVIKSANIKAE